MTRHTAKTMIELRERLGLSQTELARRMGYARAYINRLENDRLKISAEVDERLRSVEAGVTYQETSQPDAAVAEDPPPPVRVQIQSQHALPPRTPTEQELVNEFCRIVSSAHHIPGALWEIRRVLKVHLSPEILEKLKD